MQYLIMGRSGAGKDTLASMMAENGLIVLKSYSTRPKRFSEEDSHNFISEDEAAKITNRIAETVINGYSYFVTKDMVENSDVFIVDPYGAVELMRNMPDLDVQLIYVKAASDGLRQEMAVARGDVPEIEEEIYESRCASEDGEFTDFENWFLQMDENSNPAVNPLLDYSVLNHLEKHLFINEYTEDSMTDFVNTLFSHNVSEEIAKVSVY